jgi:uracil-DNA glycosylase
VQRLRASRGGDSIPNFDPTEGGVEASILLLFEAPGPRATTGRGSGFISPDNDDASAENMWHLLAEAEVDRRDIVNWNIVPWYVGDERRIRAVNRSDLQEAKPALEELLTLIPRVQVIVLLGRAAARGWGGLGLKLPAVEAPHPSPRNLNSRPAARGQIRSALEQAKVLAKAR